MAPTPSTPTSTISTTIATTTTTAAAGEEAPAACEIGSIPLGPEALAEWLWAAAADIQLQYGKLHPYVAAALCVIGMLMNAVTIMVLTRRTMRSPVNVLLCAVAMCDIVVMSSYLVFVSHFLIAAAGRCSPSDYSRPWALFTMFHAHASVIFHATSSWLTVSLAQIRVLTIRRATLGPTQQIGERFTMGLAFVTVVLMALVNAPNFLTFEVVEVPASAFLQCLSGGVDGSGGAGMGDVNDGKEAGGNGTLVLELVNATTTAGPAIIVENSSLMSSLFNSGASAMEEEVMVYSVRAEENDCMKLKLAFWSNGMIFKVVPCLLLTASIVSLLRIISEVGTKRRHLAAVMRRKVPKDHTTPMLVAVLSIFLVAELPQGVMLVMTGVFSSESFHKRIYQQLGDLMDLLSLLNSAIGFVIYVGMSRKFRTVFLNLLRSWCSCCAGCATLCDLLRFMLTNKPPVSPLVAANHAGQVTPNAHATMSRSHQRTSSNRRLRRIISQSHHHNQHTSAPPTLVTAAGARGGGGGKGAELSSTSTPELSETLRLLVESRARPPSRRVRESKKSRPAATTTTKKFHKLQRSRTTTAVISGSQAGAGGRSGTLRNLLISEPLRLLGRTARACENSNASNNSEAAGVGGGSRGMKENGEGPAMTQDFQEFRIRDYYNMEGAHNNYPSLLQNAAASGSPSMGVAREVSMWRRRPLCPQSPRPGSCSAVRTTMTTPAASGSGGTAPVAVTGSKPAQRQRFLQHSYTLTSTATATTNLSSSASINNGNPSSTAAVVMAEMQQEEL